jgi:hypothetical protein
MQRGQIVIVRSVGHQWNDRPVLVSEVGDGHHAVELLEEQSLPGEKRLTCLIHQSVLEVVSAVRQQQIAGTMGLRLEALPYVG